MKLSRSQLEVLRIIHDAGDRGAETTVHTGGRLVSGNVAASLERRRLVRASWDEHVRRFRYVATAAGCAELASRQP